MSAWIDPAAWARLRAAETCPVCLRGRPHDIVAELDATYLIATEAAPMKGYCFLLLKRHAIELYELAPDEAVAFTRDLQRAAKAVHEVTRAVKLNYEIHGNTIPHLHVHLYPRYAGDPFEGQPINPRSITHPVYAPGELAQLVDKIRAIV